METFLLFMLQVSWKFEWDKNQDIQLKAQRISRRTVQPFCRCPSQTELPPDTVKGLVTPAATHKGRQPLLPVINWLSQWLLVIWFCISFTCPKIIHAPPSRCPDGLKFSLISNLFQTWVYKFLFPRVSQKVQSWEQLLKTSMHFAFNAFKCKFHAYTL